MSGDARPPTVEELLNPSVTDALDTAGTLAHFVGESVARREEFARWCERHPGDLDADLVLAVLSAVHDVLVPGCPYPVGSPLPGEDERP